MVRFEPFTGVRYDASDGTDLTSVAAPPYDVIDDHERVELEAADPHNSVRLILPQDEHRAGDRYARAASAYREWLAQGVLRVDPGPRFYGYRMDYGAVRNGAPRHTLGVIGALGLPRRVGEDGILPHERTLPKAKSDRLDLLRALRVNVDPIWGLTLHQGFSALVDESALLAHCHDESGVEHRLFAIDDADRIAAIRAAVGDAPLVLADGHHRFETACTYRDERPPTDAGAQAIMTFVVELSDDELCIEPIHRLVSLPDGFDARAALADAFTVTPLEGDARTDVDALVVVDHDGRARLDAKPAIVERLLAGEHPAVASADAAVVEHVVVPRWRGAEWVYRHDAAEVRALVEKGAYSAGLLLRAPTVAATRAAAMAGVRMPQKTTFFWPKPRTGMVFRPLD